MNLTVRTLESKDIALIASYWLSSSDTHLIGMGVDLNKMPTKPEFVNMLNHQLTLEDKEKQSFALIWELNGKPIGHSNVNKIVFGKEAYMHLHLWDNTNRKSGYGLQLIKLSLEQFFKVLHLERIICEPYALNPAPNKVLEKAGFTFERRYKTVPGSINFEQDVNRWEITKTQFIEHY